MGGVRAMAFGSPENHALDSLHTLNHPAKSYILDCGSPDSPSNCCVITTKYNMKIKYLLATWSGSRNLLPNPPNYLPEHLQILSKLQHDCEVVIGVPHNPDMPQDYSKFLHSIAGEYAIIEMPNSGMSYGQYAKMIATHSDADYWIIIEDDYVPCVHNFDQILVEMIDRKNVDYLCGLWMDKKTRWRNATAHAAISNGIIRNTPKLSRVVFPPWQHYSKSQVQFSEALLEARFNIADWMDEYQCQFSADKIVTYRDKSERDLIVPLLAEPSSEVLYPQVKPSRGR